MPNLPVARWKELTLDLDRALNQQLTVAFLGSASAGKDAAIRALFGVDFGEVDPIPGSTEGLRVVALDDERRFLVVNAPGFGDLRPEVDDVARQVLDTLDLVVYVVNAEGGATIDERRDLQAILDRAGGDAATLVCLNKIDLIREHQREAFIEATLRQLGVGRQMAVACAFDPLPQIADAPIGLDAVIGWISDTLRARGKHLLFSKHLRDRRASCQPLIRVAARRAGVAGAVPVPGADITAVTWIQVRLVEEIAAVHGQPLSQEVVLWMVGELLAGGSKGFIRWAIQGLKAAGWIPGAQAAQLATAALASAVAAGATFGTGEAAIRYIQSDGKLKIEDLKTIFDHVARTRAEQLRDKVRADDLFGGHPTQ